MLKLYDYFRSSASFRVRIALNLKHVNYKVIPIHLINNNGEQHSPAYRRINPQGLVPALQDDTHIITQSLAIIEYLNEQYPTPGLLADNPYHTALIRSFALTITADIHPLNNLRVLQYLSASFNISDKQKSDWYQHWIMSGLTALEKQINHQPVTNKYCFGNTPSLADVCLVPQLYNARRFNCSLADFPRLAAIDAECQQLSAFQDAWPVEVQA